MLRGRVGLWKWELEETEMIAQKTEMKISKTFI